MNIFSKRPLFSACMLYLLFAIIGVFLSAKHKTVLIFAFIAMAIISLLAYIFNKIKANSALVIVLSTLMIAMSLASSFAYFDIKAKSFERYYGSSHTVEAIVISEENRSENWSEYEIYVTKIDGEKNEHKATLICTYSSVLSENQSFVANLSADGFENGEGSYSEKLDKLSREIHIQYTSGDESSMMMTNGKSYYRFSLFHKINSYFERIFLNNLDRDTAQMSSALLLGNKNELPLTVKRDFSRAGVSHILALSGMHMTIIMGLFMFLLKKLGINRKVIAIILSVFSLMYLFITGCSLSAARSVIMLLVFYMSILFSSTPDPLTSLGIAGAVLMIIMPGTVLNSGFWMSFAATFGLLVYMPAFNNFSGKLLNKANEAVKAMLRPINAFISAIAASFFAMIPLIIVMCVFIKQVSLFTPVSSAVLAIPSSGAILFSLLFIPFHSVPVISTVIGNLLHNISSFMTDFCAYISDMEGMVFSINYPFASFAAVMITVALLFSLAFKFKKAVVSVIPFVLSVAIFITCIAVYDHHERDSVTVSYCNVSTVSDMLVLSSNKQAVILDIGNGSYKAYGVALDSAFNAKATEIKAIVLTKYYRSTSSTLYSVFASNKVRELWMPSPKNADEYNKMAPLLSVAENFGVKTYVYNEGEELTAFSTTKINISRSNIDRSSVPIIMVNIRQDYRNLLYCSSGFNELNSEKINEYISNADYIVFGNVGPIVKKPYSLPQKNTADLLIFADKTHAAYFNRQKNDHATFALVEGTCNIQLTD